MYLGVARCLSHHLRGHEQDLELAPLVQLLGDAVGRLDARHQLQQVLLELHLGCNTTQMPKPSELQSDAAFVDVRSLLDTFYRFHALPFM